MFNHVLKNVLPRYAFRCTPNVWQHSRGRCDPSDTLDYARTLLDIFVDRHFISPGHRNVELFKRGTICSYGPLGTELRENVLHQWWRSMSGSKDQVFGINTPSSSGSQNATGGHLRVAEPDDLQKILKETELSREQLVQNLHMLLQISPLLRTSLFHGSTPILSLLLILLRIKKILSRARERENNILKHKSWIH